MTNKEFIDNEMNMTSKDYRKLSMVVLKRVRAELEKISKIPEYAKKANLQLRKIARVEKDNKDRLGTVKQSTEVIRNISTTKKQGDSMDLNLIGMPKITHENTEISATYKNILARPIISRLLDLVAVMIDDIEKSGGEITSGEHEFRLPCDWDILCKKGRFEGNDRRELKKVLFQSRDLERIEFIMPTAEAGKSVRKRYKIRFISTIIEESTEFKKGNIEANKIGRFILGINERIYRYVSKKKGKSVGHFTITPRYLTEEITKIIEEIKTVQSSLSMLPKEAVIHYSRSKERVIKIVNYALNKWATGAENRKDKMTIKYRELVNEGLLDRKRRQQSNGDMLYLGYFLHALNESNHLFKDAKSILYSPHYNGQIVIEISL